MDIQMECARCGREFVAHSPHALYCTKYCRTNKHRKPSTEARARMSEQLLRIVDPEGLIKQTHDALERANAIETFNGQLALQLAQEVATKPTPALSKELRAVMADALEHQISKPTEGEPPPGPAPEEEDPLDKARRERALAREAALAAGPGPS